MKAFDISKFRKNVTKNISGVSLGFYDPDTWISTGSYALNYLISGNFNNGIPLGKVTVIAGESGAGKSYIASGNIIRNAQEQGIFVILFDSENALDESWLQALGVDTDENKLMRITASMINDVAKVISDFMKSYKEQYVEVDRTERPKVLFVIDSLGMLLTPADLDQFEKGDMKGNMGHTAKQLKALVKNCVTQFGEWNIGMVATNHTYASQDMFSPDDVISGGSGPIFAASQVIAMKKRKLKAKDGDGDSKKLGSSDTDVIGIKSAIKVIKSRFSKPFESVTVQIPYQTGMNPYSGLFDLFVKKGALLREGNKYFYTDKNGKQWKVSEKEASANKDGILDTIMAEWDDAKYDLTYAQKQLSEEESE